MAEGNENLAASAPSRLGSFVRTALYTALFFGALVFWLVFEMPDSLVGNKILSELNARTPYRWQAEQLKWKFFLRPHLDATKLSLESPPRPAGFGRPPAPGLSVTLDEISLYPHLTSLVPFLFPPRVSFTGRAYEASLSGTAGANGVDLDFTAENLNFEKLKPLRDQGFDLQGLVQRAHAEVIATSGDLSKANGELQLVAKNLAFDPAMFQLGLPLPPLDLGPAELRARIVNGKVDIDRLQVGGPDKDLDIRVQGDIRLNRNVNFSQAELRVVLKLSKRVQDAMPSLGPLLANMSTPQPDGGYAMRFRGTLANLGLPTPDR